MDSDLAWSRGAKGNNQVLRRVTRVGKATKYSGRRLGFFLFPQRFFYMSHIYCRSLIIKAYENTSPDEGDDDDGIIIENQQRPLKAAMTGQKAHNEDDAFFYLFYFLYYFFFIFSFSLLFLILRSSGFHQRCMG
jgi:hypothetical protein